MPDWKEKIEEVGGSVGTRAIEYSLGHRSIRDHRVSIHHDDVLPLTISLMAHEKFRRMIAARFPIILVDEYQDTDSDWVEAIKAHFLGNPAHRCLVSLAIIGRRSTAAGAASWSMQT